MQKQMKLTLPACVLFLCLPSVFAQEQIIPKPAEITLQKGAPATLTRDSAIVPDVRDKAFLNRATQLQQILSEGTGLPLPLKTPQDAPKTPPISSSKKTPPWHPEERKPIPSNPLPAESSLPPRTPKAFSMLPRAWSR